MTSRHAATDRSAGAGEEVFRGAGFLREVLSEPFEPDEIRVITLPAPAAPPERLLRGRSSGRTVFWAGPGAPALAGLGAAHVISAAGAGRFAEVRAAAERLWPRVRALAHPGTAVLEPRLFGGFAFHHGGARPPWGRFGEATLLLPRLTYSEGAGAGAGADAAENGSDRGRGRHGGPTVEARLALTVTGREVEETGVDAVMARVGDALDRLAAPDIAEPRTSGLAAAEPVEVPGAAEWHEAVESIRARILTGRAEKIVAARRVVFRLAAPADPAAVLGRLRRDTSAETRFAFGCGGPTLVGATPERLVTRNGLDIRSEALAGSIDVRSAERASELLASVKEGAEHAFVVRAIADALGPLCDRLDHPAEPRIQRLRHVLHLQTPFEGRLRDPVHVLELVERLHPTPAVGGTPTAEAVDWITSHEPADRGWYAAPVGWFDRAGDGEFVVALRSGLLDEDRAYLYAGAGIVRDSDPDSEYAETEVKLRTMIEALGLAP